MKRVLLHTFLWFPLEREISVHTCDKLFILWHLIERILQKYTKNWADFLDPFLSCDLIRKDSPINLYVLVSAILQKHPLHAKRRWESYLSICFRLKVKMNKGLTAFKILLFDGLMFVLWFLFPLSLSFWASSCVGFLGDEFWGCFFTWRMNFA